MPNLLNNPFACYSLINFDFLLPHIAHFDKIIVLPSVVFKTFGFMLSVFLYTLSNMIDCFFIILVFLRVYLITSLFKSFILFTLLILSLICS